MFYGATATLRDGLGNLNVRFLSFANPGRPASDGTDNLGRAP